MPCGWEAMSGIQARPFTLCAHQQPSQLPFLTFGLGLRVGGSGAFRPSRLVFQ